MEKQKRLNFQDQSEETLFFPDIADYTFNP